MRAIIASIMRLSSGCGGRPRLQNLQRALHAGERVTDLVRDDRRQLSELGEGRLIDELLLDGFARR